MYERVLQQEQREEWTLSLEPTQWTCKKYTYFLEKRVSRHVHNHPQVVAHDVKHEYIRVCCVLWGFPYTETIIQPILSTYTFPYTDTITDHFFHLALHTPTSYMSWK